MVYLHIPQLTHIPYRVAAKKNPKSASVAKKKPQHFWGVFFAAQSGIASVSEMSFFPKSREKNPPKIKP